MRALLACLIWNSPPSLGLIGRASERGWHPVRHTDINGNVTYHFVNLRRKYP